ncbi:MAG: CPBP family intramembrane glutamic endopeptidase [Bacteroidales bacterium]
MVYNETLIIFEEKMIRSLFKDMSAARGIMLTLLLACIGFLVFLLLGIITVAILSGTWDPDMLTTFSTETALGLHSVRIMQMFQTAGLFVFPSVAIALLASNNSAKFLGFKKIPFNLLLLSIIMMVTFIPGINLIGSLNAEIPVPEWMINMEKSAEHLIKRLLITDNSGTLILNLFVVAVLPAIGEELLFRSVLQKYFCRLTGNVLVGIIITSLVFSAIHLQFLGFFPRFLLGMMFGYLYVWTGSIWAPIAVHFTNNGLAVFAYFFIGMGVIPKDSETIGEVSDMWQLGMLSLIAGGALLWLIWKNRTTHQDLPDPAQASEGL